MFMGFSPSTPSTPWKKVGCRGISMVISHGDFSTLDRGIVGFFSASKMVSYSTEMGDGTIVGHQSTENGEKFGELLTIKMGMLTI